MPTCLNCGANLAAEWKFCVYCGTPVATVSPRRRGATREAADWPAVPSAIRPEPEPDAGGSGGTRRLVGVAIALAVTVLVVWVGIVVLGGR